MMGILNNLFGIVMSNQKYVAVLGSKMKENIHALRPGSGEEL